MYSCGMAPPGNIVGTHMCAMAANVLKTGKQCKFLIYETQMPN